MIAQSPSLPKAASARSSPAASTRPLWAPAPRRCPLATRDPVTTHSGNGTTDTETRPFLAPPAAVSAAVDSPALRIWAPLAVALGLSMLIDAAYSGDWSRIGAITKDQELQLQGIVPVAVAGHGACAAAAGWISAQRGENWAPRAAKTLVAGFVGLVEVILLPQEEKTDQKK